MSVTIHKDPMEAIENGINTLADTVTLTLGPDGRNILIDMGPGRAPLSTRDGVTVASHITLKDRVEDYGAAAVKEAARNTNTEAGDGPQPLYSKVLTPNGFVNMGDLKVGDVICGTNGSHQNVIEIFKKGKKEIVEVEFENNGIVECCEDHLWKVTTSYGAEKIVTTKSMMKDYVSVNDYGEYSYKYYTPQTFAMFNQDDRDLPIDSYTLGVLIGDGCFRDSGSIEVSLGMSKEHIISKLIFPEGIKINVSHVSDKNYFRLKITGKNKNNKTIRDILSSIGLKNTSSGSKFIPKVYLYSSNTSRSALLHGLIDTDGHINNRNRFEYSTISEQLSNDFVDLCSGLGIKTFKYLRNKNNDNSYSCTPIYRISQLKGYKYGTKIIRITKTGRFTEMQCIKVSNQDNLYITDCYNVTHNTTTATVLARSIFTEGAKFIKNGYSPIKIKRSIDDAVTKAVESLKELSISVADKLAAVATISANNDKFLGSLIAEGITRVGKDGTFLVENSTTGLTHLKYQEGMKIERGWGETSPYFMNDTARLVAEYENPYFAIIDDKIDSFERLDPILRYTAKEKIALIMCIRDIEDSVLAWLVANKLKGGLKLAVIKTPGFNSSELIEDFAHRVGARSFNPDWHPIDSFKPEDLGSAKRVIVGRVDTTIIEGCGDITGRLSELNGQASAETDPIKKGRITDRINRLTSSIATLHIAAESETEMKDMKLRIEDAINASRAALAEGVVPGGGVALLRLAVDRNTPGGMILSKAFEQPFRQILVNADANPEEYIDEVRNGDKMNGFNAYTGKIESMWDSGILDPVRVTRTALSKAASVASMLLTTGHCIVKEQEQKCSPTKP